MIEERWDLRSAAERALVTNLRRAPTSLRERLSLEPRSYEGVPLDDDVRLLLGLQRRLRLPQWYELPLERARRDFTRSARLFSPRTRPLHSIEDVVLDGPAGPLRARLYRPAPPRERSAVLVFFHGGGFVLGGLDSHEYVCRSLAVGARCKVLSVDYRLAPEHPYPAAVDDAVAAFRQAVLRADSLGFDRERVAVGGDSAGGYLAAQVALRVKLDGDETQPVLQLLVYPAADLTMSQRSIQELGQGLLLEERTMRWFVDQFAPAPLDRASALLSPLARSEDELRGVAPAHVQTAGFDPLRDEGAAYAALLERAGVRVEHKHYGSLVHGYLNVSSVCDRAVAPYSDAIDALTRAFAKG